MSEGSASTAIGAGGRALARRQAAMAQSVSPASGGSAADQGRRPAGGQAERAEARRRRPSGGAGGSRRLGRAVGPAGRATHGENRPPGRPIRPRRRGPELGGAARPPSRRDGRPTRSRTSSTRSAPEVDRRRAGPAPCGPRRARGPGRPSSANSATHRVARRHPRQRLGRRAEPGGERCDPVQSSRRGVPRRAVAGGMGGGDRRGVTDRGSPSTVAGEWDLAGRAWCDPVRAGDARGRVESGRIGFESDRVGSGRGADANANAPRAPGPKWRRADLGLISLRTGGLFCNSPRRWSGLATEPARSAHASHAADPIDSRRPLPPRHLPTDPNRSSRRGRSRPPADPEGEACPMRVRLFPGRRPRPDRLRLGRVLDHVPAAPPRGRSRKTPWSSPRTTSRPSTAPR